VLTLGAVGVAAGEESIRLRIDWGGAQEELWQGVIAISQGTLSGPSPLGIEADEPGSMWLDRGPLFAAPAAGQTPTQSTGPEMDQLVIRQRSPRTYDGVDVSVTAPLKAKLLIALWKSRGRSEPKWITIPVAELVSQPQVVQLDDRGNRLSVRRAPGDKLRVAWEHDSLVFSPGETLKLQVRPHLLDAEPDTKVQLKLDLAAGRAPHGELIWEAEMVTGQPFPAEREILLQLPNEEGVYDLLLTATRAPRLRLPRQVRLPEQVRLPSQVPGTKPLAARRIQLVVLSPDPQTVPREQDGPPRRVEEIDPANPKWWERFAVPHPRAFPRLWKGPLGNGYLRTREHPLGPIVQLGPAGDSDELAWEAYTLPIEEPGRPHVLEIDYPSDVPQTMGISIIEPNVAGAVLPIGLDSGVELVEEVIGQVGEPRWLQHRVVFWPKTKSPMVLITDRRDAAPAVYGKIRVLAFGQHLPPFVPLGTQPSRLMAAYLDRPLLPEGFSATQSLVASNELAVDDWLTFYQGGTRLVEYLAHAGFGGLMISVLADGSTIYPSALLEPTPRYDTGVFQEGGQDPVRKDVLEMLFRLFDRQRLALIPAVDFAAPLPRLEAELRGGEREIEGIRWIGEEGKSWLQTHRPARGTAPYYNVLDPRVQEAMLAVIREMVGRYAHHPSFAGLGLQLSAQGYAQLSGPGWGLDDVTIARFEREMKVRVPGEGPGRFAERARFLTTEMPRPWLDWRADQLGRFYRRIQAELTAVRPDARLYLAGADMLSGSELQRGLQPALPREMAITEAMLRVGVDLRDYEQEQGIVLLRPERITPQWSLARQAVNLEIRQMLDIEQKHSMKLPFEDLPRPGSLFFHEPQGARVPSFDQQSPFQPTHTWLATHVVPSNWQNRRRFVHSLATLDSQVMFDGGWQLPFGQEESIRAVIAAYRQLPAVRFERLVDQYGSDPAQPLVIRHATHAGATYLYVVNDAPFPTAARIDVQCPAGCPLEELSGLRQVPPLRSDTSGTYWTADLEPYDLVAIRFSAPEVTLSRPQVYWPPEVETKLQARIDELKDRAATLTHSQGPPLLAVLDNPGFEAPPTADAPIPGWTASSVAGSAVELDASDRRGGVQSVRLVSQGPTVSLISHPFAPPTTGRLTMAVWLRASDTGPPPTLRYVLEGPRQGIPQRAPFVRWQTRQVRGRWEPFVVEANDLPLEGLSSLRVRFELTGPGEVWLDDVQLCALVFQQAEKNALLKLIAPADLKLDRRRVRDCLQLLEGYWPRFLLDNVPASQAPLVRRPEPTPQPTEEPQGPPGFFDRMKALVPKKLGVPFLR
jgi:hypothetical protein